MEIKISIGNKELMLRGGDRCIELCEPRNIKNKDTGEIRQEWTAVKWYPHLLGAINCLLEMKIRNSDVNSLIELQEAVKQAKDELKGLYELNVAS
jgi:hypothetical protein